jgi:DNA-binding response OmpR family regulator
MSVITPAGRVLIVERDTKVTADLVRGLRGAGFQTELANDSATGARLARERHFDVVLLDLTLPVHSGFELLQFLSDRPPVPIIVLTAPAELSDRLKAFELGAVDFVPKPFWVEEVVARIRARLGNPAEPPPRIVRWANARVDLDARTLQVAGETVAITRFEFDLLAYLLVRPGRAITRQQLATRALASLDERNDRTIDSHLTRVRKKLGAAAGAGIATVWGVGYRFDGERSK